MPRRAPFGEPDPHKKKPTYLGRMMMGDAIREKQGQAEINKIMTAFLASFRKASSSGKKAIFRDVSPQIEKGILFRSAVKTKEGKFLPTWAEKPTQKQPRIVRETLSNLRKELGWYRDLWIAKKGVPDEIVIQKTEKKVVVIFRRGEKVVKQFREILESMNRAEVVTYELDAEGVVSAWMQVFPIPKS